MAPFWSRFRRPLSRTEKRRCWSLPPTTCRFSRWCPYTRCASPRLSLLMPFSEAPYSFFIFPHSSATFKKPKFFHIVATRSVAPNHHLQSLSLCTHLALSLAARTLIQISLPEVHCFCQHTVHVHKHYHLARSDCLVLERFHNEHHRALFHWTSLRSWREMSTQSNVCPTNITPP